GSGSTPGIRPIPSSTGATKARRSLHGAPEYANGAASLTNRNEPVRGSARRPAGKARIEEGLISVTAGVTVTPPPSTSTESESDTSEVFRYVRHDDVAKFMAEGWEQLPALEGTHYAEHAVLMRRRPRAPRGAEKR